MTPRKPPYRPLLMADVLAAEGRSGLKVASTFSGAGGSCLGYRLAGYTVVWANEFEPNAQATYALNAPSTILDPRDIRTILPEEILAVTGLERGELDLFDGSPPCQSFSTAGKKQKGWGKSIAHGDGTTQRSDNLFAEYVRLVDGLQPRVFVAENVTGMVKGVSKGAFLRTLADLKACGYKVAAAVVNAQWLGVPQARQRVIFLGVRNDLAALGFAPVYPTPNPWFYSVADALPWIGRHSVAPALADWVASGRDPSSTMVPAGSSPSPTVLAFGPTGGAGDRVAGAVAIHDTGSARGAVNREFGHDACPTVTVGNGKAIHYQTRGACELPGLDEVDRELIALGKSAARAWGETKVGSSHPVNFSSKRSGVDAPAFTVAGYAGNVNEDGVATAHGMAHPHEPRRFTIAELRRLCSFPDDFRMAGKFADRWARLGNSVPPLMMRAIAETIRDRILFPAKAAETAETAGPTRAGEV
jgi:DNA (cytosine-5)-methyltransferase 1